MKDSTRRIEAVTWPLIYSGLALLGLGLAVRPTDDVLGTSMAVIGGTLALVGVLLIFLRSRIKDDGADRP